MVTSIITGMKTFETPLVTCRIGVPESRVDRINLTTRVSIALPLIPAVWHCSDLALPTAVLAMESLARPIIGTDLLATTDLLIVDELVTIILLIGSRLLGWTVTTLLIVIRLIGTLLLTLFCIMWVPPGRNFVNVCTVLLALIWVCVLSNRLISTSATIILIVLKHGLWVPLGRTRGTNAIMYEQVNVYMAFRSISVPTLGEWRTTVVKLSWKTGNVVQYTIGSTSINRI